MADNVAFTPGSGATGATDDIGGVHYPRVKLALGADGTAVDAVAGAGASGTGVQRVTLATDSPGVTTLGQATAANSLPVVLASNDTLVTAVKAEDAAHTTADTGIPALAVRRDAKAVGSGTDGDYSTLNVTADGDLRVDGGKAFMIVVAPTVTAGAYTAGDTLGGEMTLTAAARVSGGSGILTGISMAVLDDGANLWVANDVEVVIFKSNPAGTYTDNATLNGTAFTDADSFLIVDTVLLDTVSALGDVKFLKARNLNVPYVCSGSADLFAVALNRGARTPDATNAIQFTFHMIRD